jgi:hypothetical protein
MDVDEPPAEPTKKMKQENGRNDSKGKDKERPEATDARSTEYPSPTILVGHKDEVS